MQTWIVACLLAAGGLFAGAAHAQKSAAPPPQSGPVCLLADFRALALTTHDPSRRLELAQEWMEQHAMQCSIDQLKVLNNYRPSWMGAADHPKLQGMIDSLIEARTSNDPEKLKALFTPEVTPAPEETTKTLTVKPNPRPVVAPAAPPMLNPMMQGYVQPPLPTMPGFPAPPPPPPQVPR